MPDEPYLVVFDLRELVRVDTEEAKGCLTTLLFWLQSIALHSMGKDKRPAPVYLVGTHKDQVSGGCYDGHALGRV